MSSRIFFFFLAACPPCFDRQLHLIFSNQTTLPILPTLKPGASLENVKLLSLSFLSNLVPSSSVSLPFNQSPIQRSIPSVTSISFLFRFSFVFFPTVTSKPYTLFPLFCNISDQNCSLRSLTQKPQSTDLIILLCFLSPEEVLA